MQISIEVSKSEILKKLSSPEEYTAALKIGATEVSQLLKAHYIEKGSKEPNRLGGKRTNFWAQISESVQTPFIRGFEAVVSIIDPRIAQKIYGGPIRAKRVRYLTIPISKEAYGRRAREFSDEVAPLFPIKSKKGNRLLVSRVDGGIQPHYLLKEEVNQKPWPGSLPSAEQIKEAFSKGLKLFLQFGRS